MRRSLRSLRAARPAALLALAAAPAFAADNELVSVSTAGVQANDASYYSLLSADGRFVVFQSQAGNLAPNDFNGTYDVYRRDLAAGVTELVSVSLGGLAGNGLGLAPALSGDGNLVVWSSNAANLVAGDTNGTWDVFLRDMTAGVTTRISLQAGGAESPLRSDSPRITPDGRYVTFESDAALVAADGNGQKDCYRLDRVTGALELVSVTATGGQGSGWSYHSHPSDDGRLVTFVSAADDLVPGDTNGVTDVFVKDMATGALTRASVATGGAQANGESVWPTLSGGGGIVVFSSVAGNLVGGDTNGQWDLFARELASGTTTRLNVQPNGTQANSYVHSPVGVSTDGRFVAYASLSSNLVPGDTNGKQDVFVRDRAMLTTERVSLAQGGGEADGDSFVPHLSADARVVTFTSDATNLVASDTNARRDIFARDLGRSIGATYCGPAPPNSSGRSATMSAEGSAAVAANDVTLVCEDMPPGAFAYFLTSRTQGFVAHPGGSQGNLCLGGAIGRFVGPGQVQHSGAAGRVSLAIDLAAHPTPGGPALVLAGEAWSYQCWFRDLAGGAPTSNLSDGLEIDYL